MVSAQDEEILGIFDFVREQETYRLETLLAAVDVVPEKEIVGLRRKATVLK